MAKKERRKRHCKFVYNEIQQKINFYFFISVENIARMNVLVYNNQFDIWSLYKMS